MGESETPTASAGEVLRGKWLMDGAESLAQAADRLDAEARRLRVLGERGWALAGPVTDDYGVLVDPSGSSGPDEG